MMIILGTAYGLVCGVLGYFIGKYGFATVEQTVVEDVQQAASTVKANV